MNDILNQDAILSETILKPCSKCGHPRGKHTQDRKCETKNCNCKFFRE